MAVHMVTQVDGLDYRITLSRDDAGNYVAEAARCTNGHAGRSGLPTIRVLDPLKERALRTLFDALSRAASDRAAEKDGPDAPAAA